jgi:hypothetical protein
MEIELKKYTSDNYNWVFSPKSGFFCKWGKTIEDNPEFSPIGPELADIEVSTICTGINGTPCPWCYKSNTSVGTNMSLSIFSKVVKNINPYSNLTQIALGIGSVDANPDLIPIMKWCRKNDIIPNITVNGANLNKKYEDKTYYEWIAELCGAVSVSHYDDDICFNAVKKFTDLNMHTVNIHQIIAKETMDDCFKILKNKLTDSRLFNMRSIVFLSLKEKGKRNTMHIIDDMVKYKELIDFAKENHISIGFDSCGANRFLDTVKDDKDYEYYEEVSEPCEADSFSFYINVNGIHFPCSFCENENNNGYNWTTGIDLKKNNLNFIDDVWHNKRVEKFRKATINNCRKCVMFNV